MYFVKRLNTVGKGNWNCTMKVVIIVLNLVSILQTSTSESSTGLASTLIPTTESTTTPGSGKNDTLFLDECTIYFVTMPPGRYVNFISPNYPENYNTFQECAWFFSTAAGYKIDNLHVQCTDMYFSWFSYLIITEEEITTWYGCFFCSYPISIDRTLRSTNVDFLFRNDFHFTAKGFSCTIFCTKSINCVCGESEDVPLRVGGEVAQENEFPWVASIVARGETYSLCAGALIHSRFVVTAAHCTVDTTRLLDVRLGVFDLTTNPPTAVRRQVKKIIQHPNFNDRTWDNDVSLLRIELVVFSQSPTVRPICLPSSDFSSYVGREVVVAGWGRTCAKRTNSASLLKLTLPVVNNTDCDQQSPLTITDRMMCTGVKAKDSCAGDSGAPVMLTKSDYYELVGLVSFGNNDERGPTVNTRITAVVTWIKSQLVDGKTCTRPGEGEA